MESMSHLNRVNFLLTGFMAINHSYFCVIYHLPCIEDLSIKLVTFNRHVKLPDGSPTDTTGDPHTNPRVELNWEHY